MKDIITPQQFEALLPLAVTWAAEQERTILQSGVPLTESQLADARQVGVLFPERARLLRVAQIPTPSHPMLAAAVAATGIISPSTGGMTLRYGIYIRTDCWGQRLLVAHELVHTSQYERFGGLEAFLRPCLMEYLTPPGYPHGPIEQEADVRSRQLCAEHDEEPIRKLVNLLLEHARKQGAEKLVIAAASGKQTPVRCKTKTGSHELESFPAVLRPAVVGELARLANLAGGKFPKEGVLDFVTSGASSSKWRLKATSAEAECVLTPIGE